ADGSSRLVDRSIVVAAADRPAEPILAHLLNPGPGPLLCPKWSPDGRYLAGLHTNDMYLIEPAPGGRSVIPFGSASHMPGGDAWARDSSRIAIVAAGRIIVFRLADEGSETLYVTAADPTSLAWAADDMSIVFVSNKGRGSTVRVWDLVKRTETALRLEGDQS